MIKSRAGDNTSDWLRHVLNSDANLTEGNQTDLRNQSSAERQLITNQLVGLSAMQQTSTMVVDHQHIKLPEPNFMLRQEQIGLRLIEGSPTP